MANATVIGGQGQMPNPFIGSYTGSGCSAQTINIGFQPNAIIAWNKTDGDTAFLWTSGDECTYMKVAACPATVCAAIAKACQGFSLAACDAIANECGKTYYFLAFR